MITIENTRLTFICMGYVSAGEAWERPAADNSTYEMVYVAEGKIRLEAQGRPYTLKENSLMVYKPSSVGEGPIRNVGEAAFYWVRFALSGQSRPVYVTDGFESPALLKELYQVSRSSVGRAYQKEAILLYILSKIACGTGRDKNQLVSEVYEWLRQNASNRLTVRDAAAYFGYNGEYLSRLVKAGCGVPIKKLIDRFILLQAENYLCRTRLSVKEISALLGFETENAFLKFFKYHEKRTPKDFRSTYGPVKQKARQP